MLQVALSMVEIAIYLSRNPAVNHPVSLYAATKKSNELVACYSHLYGLQLRH